MLTQAFSCHADWVMMMERLRVCSPSGSRSMLRALSLLLFSAMLWSGAAQSCEKHLNGHQTNSDTNAEAVNR